MENETIEPHTEEQRKAVITVTEGENIDVTIEFFPDAITENPTPSAHLAMIGFQAIARVLEGIRYSKRDIYAEHNYWKEAPAAPTLKLEDVKRAPHRPIGEEPEHEGTSSMAKNKDASTISRCPVQLPPLAADLEGLAVSLGVLAGNVSPEQWEFLKIFRSNLRAAAERVAALENNLGALYE